MSESIENPKCELCGEPMPAGEEMFKFHGYSGPCPKPPLPKKNPPPHPSISHLMQFFSYAHLPPHLQEASKPFSELAERIANGPNNPETANALRKLLEAKDCAVRAILSKETK